MGVRVVWTPEMDRQLVSLRQSGLTWTETATALCLGRNTAIERGRRIGAKKLCQKPRPLPPEDRDRPPRPPGHPESWNLINKGLCLEGTPYPFPVFL